MSELNEKINQSLKELEKIEDKKSKEYAKKLEKLGVYYFENENVEKAIDTLEESLSIHATIGDGYKTLMKIYNAKRAEAAKSGDMNEINKWLDKMDEMRNIAKLGTILR